MFQSSGTPSGRQWYGDLLTVYIFRRLTAAVRADTTRRLMLADRSLLAAATATLAVALAAALAVEVVATADPEEVAALENEMHPYHEIESHCHPFALE
jgi:hypothetical protein